MLESSGVRGVGEVDMNGRTSVFRRPVMQNNEEEIRERCKKKTNIKAREEAGVAKTDGVDDDDDETEGTGGRETPDELEEFGSRKVVRKHDPRQPSQQERRNTR